jgi:hypothetical protein
MPYAPSGSDRKKRDKIQVNVSLHPGFIIKHHDMKTYGRVEYSSTILNLGTTWR